MFELLIKLLSSSMPAMPSRSCPFVGQAQYLGFCFGRCKLNGSGGPSGHGPQCSLVVFDAQGWAMGMYHEQFVQNSEHQVAELEEKEAEQKAIELEAIEQFENEETKPAKKAKNKALKKNAKKRAEKQKNKKETTRDESSVSDSLSPKGFR